MASYSSSFFSSPLTGNPCASRAPPSLFNLENSERTEAYWKEKGGVT
jgi:hypothetical protein